LLATRITTLALKIVRRRSPPIHELESVYAFVEIAAQGGGSPYSEAILVALRVSKITASDPPSTLVAGRR